MINTSAKVPALSKQILQAVPPRLHLCGGLTALLFCLCCSPLSADDLYQREIRPLLAQKCAACHGVLRQAGGLRLDFGGGIHHGGESGPAVIPGQPEQSLLLQKVNSSDDTLRMPPAGEGERLNRQQLELVTSWIAAGARFPADEQPPADPAAWWSCRAIHSPPVPQVNQKAWVRNPIDAFISQQHDSTGLQPSPDARPEVLLRRLYLDLIGIPPTRAELQAWLADSDPQRYEKTVDQLLNRLEYGQRWGRHWMDVWRYSDWYGSRGINEIRYSQRHIWRWRDWIVESLNADKPYDRMIQEMLAGDELAPADPDVLRATGFLGRNWYKFDRNVWMFETVEQTAQAFLGLTLRCARCHDHKFDPITHEDYYRFRAFFEPHDVRTDPFSGNLNTEKDATLGPVLKEGIARVFDREPEAPTFLFERGDNRYPDKTRPIMPGVPAILGGSIEITPVSLPVEAWYPHLRPEVADDMLQRAELLVNERRAQLEAATATAAAAEAAATQAEAAAAAVSASGQPTTPPAPILQDTFQQPSPVWKALSGDWQWKDGVLRETAVTSFATITAEPVLPRNFEATVRWRTLQPGSYRSVGFSFDYLNPGDSQDVYTSTGDAAQSIQAFHRLNGQQQYPAAGIVSTPLKVGEETRVDIAVRDQQLIIRLNGEQKLDYIMPTPRREGRFALWVHQGSAEFLEVSIRPLVPTPASLRSAARQQQAAAQVAVAAVETAAADRAALQARLAAENARSREVPSTQAQPLAIAAARAEKQAAIAAARTELVTAQNLLEETLLAAQSTAQSAALPAASPDSPAVAAARKKVDEVLGRIATLETQRDSGAAEFTPIAPAWPKTSSGRRLALARWIASPDNPRTARIAVNHIWLRHFGEALVPSVANFGLNGSQPSHPELLDWLAAQLIQNGWRMKPLHRLIVLSSVYRQSSATAVADPATNPAAAQAMATNVQLDPANRWLWRMNSRRMEAESVRDSLLAASSQLDVSHGGPEIPEQQMQLIPRRSLYFRNTPNEKATLLEPFDVANPNECYRRQSSVIPQQALALLNSGLAIDSARRLAEQLRTAAAGSDGQISEHTYIYSAFETVLSRPPAAAEITACETFLSDAAAAADSGTVYTTGPETARLPPSTDPRQRARENLLLVLFSHNDFVTIR
ncbi:MAG: DUF1553 domain-containing protein [Planctomycetaceae bacterium]